METNVEENVGVDFGLFGFVDFDDIDEIVWPPSSIEAQEQNMS